MKDLVIIGAGSAGMAAAIYAGRYDLDTVVIAKETGGLLNEATTVENYPGFTMISGYELMKKFKEHVETLKVPIVYDTVKKVQKIKGGYEVNCEKETYKAKTVVFATGSLRRKLNVPGEKEYTGKGVAYCATCDGALFQGVEVGVVGGSNSAAQAAILLSQYASKVYIIYRKEKIRADPIYHDRIAENKKIEMLCCANVTEIKGDGKAMTSVVLDIGKELPLEGLFIEIGWLPATDLAKDLGVELDEKKLIKINDLTETNLPGVYAAGDCTTRPFKQAVVAAADGSTAAYAAFNYIKSMK
ncbi:MAG: FAD-dependent oxidoreductase [archaeon]